MVKLATRYNLSSPANGNIQHFLYTYVVTTCCYASYPKVKICAKLEPTYNAQTDTHKQ